MKHRDRRASPAVALVLCVRMIGGGVIAGGVIAGGAIAGAIGAGCGDVEVPPFPDGQGQKPTTIAYPSGPYGVSQQQIISDYSFVGFAHPQEAADPNAMQTISLSDFFNPDGQGVFPAGSPYGEGTPKPKALLIDIGAVWCSPCQYEAKTILPPEYLKFHPQGAEFLFVLADGPMGGVPAQPSELVNWVKKYKTVYPSVLDPERKLGSVFKADAYPVNILIDTRTMEIVQVFAGAPTEDDPFFDALAATLAGP
jgi:hypothetical protein